MNRTTNALRLGSLLCAVSIAASAAADEPQYEGNALFGYIDQSPNSPEVNALRAFHEGKTSAVRISSGKTTESVFNIQVRSPADRDSDVSKQCKTFTGVLPWASRGE